jgi:hypothetical protein
MSFTDEIIDVLNTANEDPCSEEMPVATEAEMPVATEAEMPPLVEDGFEMPPQEYLHKGRRYELIFEGVCNNCAHCALKLTDADSIQFGMGPICRKRAGVNSPPVNPDEIQAMIDLAEYPSLVEFLTKKYKPQGPKALMNGLVKIASLNRKSPIHTAICDAVDSLGYKQLASVLRESIAVVEVVDHDDTSFRVWIKKSDFSWNWYNDLRRLGGVFAQKYPKRGTVVPKRHREQLWNLLNQYYSGLCVKTTKGTFKIKKGSAQAVASATSTP